MNILRAALALALPCVLSIALAAEGPSVLVATVPLQKQALPDVVSGYGVIAPDPDSIRTLSMARPGEILRIQVHAGERVTKGRTLLEFGTSAEAQLANRQAQQSLESARGERSRVAALLEQQLATRTQLAAADKVVVDAQAVLREQHEVGADRSSERVTAPFDGVVVTLPVTQGDRVAAGAPLLQLARSGSQRLLMGVEPGDVRSVRPGMPVEVRSVIDPSPPIRGHVVRVFAMVNPQTQLVDVLVEIPERGLITGTRVSASIEVARPTGWVVPRSAVLRDAHGVYLFQVVQGKARRVDVRTGLEHEDRVAVQGAKLEPAQQVVSQGNYELQEGMAVREADR